MVVEALATRARTANCNAPISAARERTGLVGVAVAAALPAADAERNAAVLADATELGDAPFDAYALSDASAEMDTAPVPLLARLRLVDAEREYDADAGVARGLTVPGCCERVTVAIELAALLVEGLACADAAAGAVAHDDTDSVAASLGAGDALPLTAASTEREGVLEKLARGDAEELAPPLPLPHEDGFADALTLSLVVGDCEPHPLTDAQGVAVGDARGERDADGDSLEERLAAEDADADADADTGEDGVGENAGERETDATLDNDSDGDNDAARETGGLDDGVPLSVTTPVAVPVLLKLRPADALPRVLPVPDGATVVDAQSVAFRDAAEEPDTRALALGLPLTLTLLVGEDEQQPLADTEGDEVNDALPLIDREPPPVAERHALRLALPLLLALCVVHTDLLELRDAAAEEL